MAKPALGFVGGAILAICLVFSYIDLPALAQDPPAEQNWLNKDINLFTVKKDAAEDFKNIYEGYTPCRPTIFTYRTFTWHGNSKRQITKTSNELCAVQTPFGLIANGYVKFTGSKYSQRIDTIDSFVVFPVQGSRTMVVQRKFSTSYHEPATKIYYNFPAAGHADGEFNGNFKVTSSPEGLKREDGENLQVKYLAISPNGEWMAFVTDRAYARLHLRTQSWQTFARADRSNGIGHALAISNDGRYVAARKSIRGSASRLTLFDLQECAPTTNTYPEEQLMTGCASREITDTLRTSYEDSYQSFNNMRFSYDGKSLTGQLIYWRPGDSTVASGHDKVTLSLNDSLESGSEYLALGDSFSSGEGAWEYEDYTDTDLNKCRISKQSYPYLVAEILGLHEGPLKTPASKTFRSIACSGAVINDIINTSITYNDDSQAKGLANPMFNTEIISSFLPGYRAQIRFISEYTPKHSTITISGNNIGFGNKIARCLAPTTCYVTYEKRVEVFDEIAAQFDELVSLFDQLKTASPNTNFYALGYPQLVSTSGECALNVHLDASEREFAQAIVSYLNATIKAAAQKSGVFYVGLDSAFNGKRLCDGPSETLAVHGLTLGSDKLGIISNASYHPNPAGQLLMAEDVILQTSSFSAPMPEPDSSALPPSYTEPEFWKHLESAPRSSIPIKTIGYVDDLADNLIFLNDPISRMISGLPSFNLFELWINSEPKKLGDFISDENGSLQIDAALPDDLEPGFHTLHLYGKNYSGDDVDLYKTIYVAYSHEDYDGDGTPNSQEPCLIFEASGIDADDDGIDDACDGFFGHEPSNTEGTPEAMQAEANSDTNIKTTARSLGAALRHPLLSSTYGPASPTIHPVVGGVSNSVGSIFEAIDDAKPQADLVVKVAKNRWLIVAACGLLILIAATTLYKKLLP